MNDRTELTPHEIDDMVAAARKRGSRTLAVRRIGSPLAALALVAGLAVGAYAVVVSTNNDVAPADQLAPIVQSETPLAPTEGPAPTEEPSPTPPPAVETPGATQAPEDEHEGYVRSDKERSRSLESIDTLRTLLPEGLNLIDEDVTNTGPGNGARFALHDSEGFVEGVVSLGQNQSDAFGCATSLGCTEYPVTGGVVHVVDGAADGKRGQSRHITLIRDDGMVVYLSMGNVAFTGEKSWIETRAALPLTDEQAVALVTDPAWAPLLDREKSDPAQG